MSEKFPTDNMVEIENKESQEKRVDVLMYAVNDIERTWGIVNDIHGLPLDSDPAYEYGTNILDNRKHEYARVLFDKIGETEGEEKLNYAHTLYHLIQLLSLNSKNEVLTKLMTTEDAVKEIISKQAKDLESKRSISEKLKLKLKDAVDLLSDVKDIFFN